MKLLAIDHTQNGAALPAEARRRVPAYWYVSRRRYFEKNHGPLYRAASDAVFLAGYALWRVRRRLLGKPDHDPPGMLADFLRHSVARGSGAARGQEARA